MYSATNWQVTPYTLPLGVGAALFVVLGAHLLRRQNMKRALPGATRGGLLLLASGFWMGVYALELSRTDFATLVLLNQIQYLGIAPVPLLWFSYVVRHTGVEDLPKPVWAALAGVPLVTVALVFTNSAHTLIWDGLTLSDEFGYVMLVNDHSIGFLAFIIYAYTLIVVGVGLLFRSLVVSDEIYRKQTAGLLAGGLVPAIAGIVYISEYSPVPGLNLPAIAFSFAAAAVAWSVYRHRLFTLVPIAWELAAESMKGGAIVIDERDAVLDANPTGERYLDDDLSACYGRPIRDLVPDSIAAALSTDTPIEATVEVDGDERDVLVSTSRLSGGATTGRLVIIRDITDQKSRERRLERQNDRLEEFASVVSHDLRNPLTVASGYLELARETGEAEYFDRVDDAHDRMEEIIEDLLTLARQGETLSDLSPVGVQTIAREAWDSVAAQQATLEVSLDQTIDADRGRFRQLFENLFRNAVEHGSTSNEQSDDAVEHGSASSEVHIRVGPLSDGFFVEDDGTGISEAERERVFERGYTTHEEGTGFGLPIIRSIADAHGWTVELTTADSGGARFEFTDVGFSSTEVDAPKND
ncbi:histidine kinase N-terminal 7TM domain-containing protein [Haloferax sp. DFSO60]|uniref:histidine kinase N-terminal 7TM domain-containing protein n=1 Tax=Haloferax sp. DFSO60 TaxID=3388652 RepID=UPI00397CADBF